MHTRIAPFAHRIQQEGKQLHRFAIDTVQINVGKLCNQACLHCHVEAGPKRTEIMERQTAELALDFIRAAASQTVDVTGGAPELNPSFRWLVEQARRDGRHVIDRCNLTILLEPGQEDLPQFLAGQQVEVIASLPCYSEAGKEAEYVTALVSNAHGWADTMISQSPETARRACQAGCAFCCYVPTVLVTAAEAVYLADWLQAHCSADEIEALRERLADRQQQSRSSVSPPSPEPPIPCALLQNNQCMAYAARPLKCRGWNSLRRDVCEQAYGHSQSTVQIPADAYAFMMGNAVLSGLSDSAARAELDGGTYDLTAALAQALTIPDVVQRWRNGERVFGKQKTPGQ